MPHKSQAVHGSSSIEDISANSLQETNESILRMPRALSPFDQGLVEVTHAKAAVK